MSRIFIDSLRRRWWYWLAGAVVYGFMAGVGKPLKPDLSNAPFFPLAIYLGVLPLSNEFGRGIVPRVLRTLPVTSRQIGQAWWWSSVGFPAGFLGLISLITFELSRLNHQPVSAVASFYFWLTNAVLFGPQFYFFSGTPPPGVKAFNATSRGCLFSLLFGVCFLSMLWTYRLFPPPGGRWLFLVAIGIILSVAGWFRAEALARDRLTSLPTKTAETWEQALGGEIIHQQLARLARFLPGYRYQAAQAESAGGLSMLFQIICYPMAGLGLTMILISELAIFWTSHDAMAEFAPVFWPSFSMFLWLSALLVLPRTLNQIRWLRTLPVSTTQLAGVFILAPVLAMVVFMGLGNLIFLMLLKFAASNERMPWLQMVHQGCTLQIAAVTLLVPLILWRGAGPLTLVAALLATVGCGWYSAYIQRALSLPANLGLSLAIVFASFLMAKLLLDRSSTTYRPRAGQTGGLFGGSTTW